MLNALLIPLALITPYGVTSGVAPLTPAGFPNPYLPSPGR